MTKPMMIVIALSVAIFGISVNALAGEYDGTYRGQLVYKAGKTGFCNSSPIVMRINGQNVHWGGTPGFDGTVQNDGAVKISAVKSQQFGATIVNYKIEIEGKAGGGQVVGTMSNGFCEWTFSAARS